MSFWYSRSSVFYRVVISQVNEQFYDVSDEMGSLMNFIIKLKLPIVFSS